MSDKLPWKVWTPDDLAPPMAEFVLADKETPLSEEAAKSEPSLDSSSHSCKCRPMSKGITRGWRKVDKRSRTRLSGRSEPGAGARPTQAQAQHAPIHARMQQLVSEFRIRWTRWIASLPRD
ncbi:hypothetical protein ACNKHK_12675 [Shigella flexneri]